MNNRDSIETKKKNNKRFRSNSESFNMDSTKIKKITIKDSDVIRIF